MKRWRWPPCNDIPQTQWTALFHPCRLVLRLCLDLLGLPTWYRCRAAVKWTDQLVGGHAAQCFARLRSSWSGPFQFHRSLGEGIKVRKAYCFKRCSQTNITGRDVPSYTEMDEGRISAP